MRVGIENNPWFVAALSIQGGQDLLCQWRELVVDEQGAVFANGGTDVSAGPIQNEDMITEARRVISTWAKGLGVAARAGKLITSAISAKVNRCIAGSYRLVITNPKIIRQSRAGPSS